MGLRQQFRFKYLSATAVQALLRSLSSCAAIDDREDFFVFTALDGSSFTFDCEITSTGLLSERAGEFGCVEVEDA